MSLGVVRYRGCWSCVCGAGGGAVGVSCVAVDAGTDTGDVVGCHPLGIVLSCRWLYHWEVIRILVPGDSVCYRVVVIEARASVPNKFSLGLFSVLQFFCPFP